MSRLIRITALISTATLFAFTGSAQPASSKTEFTATHVWIGDAGLEGGGEMGSSQTGLRAGYSKSLGRGQSLGFSLGAAFYDYEFSGAMPVAGMEPFDNVADYSIGAAWRKPVGQAGMLFLAPSLSFAGEDGADWGESLRAGAIISYGYRFSEKLTIGIGAGVFTGLEETQAFPVLLVSWQINENWRVGNPFRPGPTGPAGIELVYAFNPAFEVGMGGGWRSNRFRLAEDGVNPDGIGEVEGFPAFARLTWIANEAVSVDLYGGVFLSGEVTWEDASGNGIASADLDSAPLAAISITAAF